jgi:hypothetical protein
MSAYITFMPSTSYLGVHMITFFNLFAVLGDNVVLGPLGLGRMSMGLSLIKGVGGAVRHFQ